MIFDTDVQRQKVIDYFSKPGSRFGYDLILWGAKHFSYYPTGRADISEKQAQGEYHRLLAAKLDIKPGERLLDAGCGEGVVSVYLAKNKGVHVTGITLVPFEAEIARRWAKKAGVSEHTDYQVMDYAATDFADNTFDAIYTTETLSHAPDIRKVLREFYRILKPGGKVVFFEYTIAPDAEFSPSQKRILDLVIQGSAMHGLRDFRHDQFPAIMAQCGFIEIDEVNLTANILPSMRRLRKIARIPYRLVSIFGQEKRFVNTTAGVEFTGFAETGLFRYCVFSGYKPA